MTVKIFFCYAHEDEALLNKLKIHLRPLQRRGLIDVWYDRDISAGTDWEWEINKHLNTSQIILLLISPDFMDSDYCFGIEMQRAIERHERGEATVIPIILRHALWQGEPLGKLQALPKDAKPVKSWPDLDEALNDVAEGIRKAAAEIMTNTTAIIATTRHYPPIDEQVSLWLDAKTAISSSQRTREAYETHISEFRKVLHKHGHDLDGEDENTISSLIQEWAASSKGEKKDVSPHTFNQRLSTIRSFYRFALKQRWIMKNPIEMIERREEPVSNVEPLDPQVVQNGFRLIDRSTLLGKRDYALFCVLFTTERLVSEVTELQCGDIAKGESGVTLTFQRVKGGKRIRQNLTSATASALRDYLDTVYGNEWPNDAPVWISDSRFNKGDAIGTQAVSGRCEKYFGTSKLEVLRRTAAEMRKRIGAKDIENLLQIN